MQLKERLISSLVCRNTRGIIYRKACLDFIGTVAHKVLATSHVRHCRGRPKCGEEQTRASKDVCGIGHLCFSRACTCESYIIYGPAIWGSGSLKEEFTFHPFKCLRYRSRNVGLTNKYSLNAEDCYTNCCQLEARQLIRGISHLKNIFLSKE